MPLALKAAPATLSRFRWDSAARRYVYRANGHAVDPLRIRQALDQTLENSAMHMGTLTAQLQSRAITVAQWQRGMMDEMRAMHTASGAMARGGWAQMSPGDWGRVGQRLRAQYQYLDQWARQLTDGAAPMDGRLTARAELYSQAPRGAYEAVRRKMEEDGGMTEEMRVLHIAEHCDECIQWAGQWAPIGTLPEIGSLQCGPRCRCSVEFR